MLCRSNTRDGHRLDTRSRHAPDPSGAGGVLGDVFGFLEGRDMGFEALETAPLLVLEYVEPVRVIGAW